MVDPYYHEFYVQIGYNTLPGACNTTWTFVAGDYCCTPTTLDIHGHVWVCGGLRFDDDLQRNNTKYFDYSAPPFHYGSCGLQADNNSWERIRGGTLGGYVSF